VIRGLTTAAAGMLADERLQQALANNLANTETPGFKPTDGEILSFPEQLIRVWGYGTGAVGPAIGVLTTGAVFQEGVPLFVQGMQEKTGRALDVAIQDSATAAATPDGGWHSFLPVAYTSPQGAAGLALTRDGHLDTDAQGVLIDAAGHPVVPVDAAGLPLYNARIVINPAYRGTALFSADGGPVIDANGQPSYTVRPAGNLAGAPVAGARLGLVDANVQQLAPLGETEWMIGGQLQAVPPAGSIRPGTGTITPGALETASVDEAATMTRMLAAVAQYEANQRVIQAEDQTLGQAVTDVGKVNA
jgi:flagellar hook protein FlgE